LTANGRAGHGHFCDLLEKSLAAVGYQVGFRQLLRRERLSSMVPPAIRWRRFSVVVTERRMFRARWRAQAESPNAAAILEQRLNPTGGKMRNDGDEQAGGQ